MTGVKHQKWWGWGEEGFTYDISAKPKFPGFVMKVVGVDVSKVTQPAPKFSDLAVPASLLGDDLRTALVDALGEANVVTDDEMRVVHAFGKGALIHSSQALAKAIRWPARFPLSTDDT